MKGVRIHFVGIKGTGMAALVELLNKRGAVITGSDVSERFYTDEILENLGIKALPFDAANISKDIQFVIHSSAYSAEKNPELAKAEELGIKLGDFMMPIRMAVTGSRVSPPLIGSILILGVEKSLARVERTLATF